MSSQFNYNEGTTGNRFTHYRTIVRPGENIVEKILDFSRRIRDSFIVYSATGTISRAEIIRPGDRNEIHEGYFSIVSLNGSYTLPEENTGRRNWHLKVQCANPNGYFAGVVGSSLIAADPTEIVLAVFTQRRPRPITARSRPNEPGSTPGSQPPEPGSSSGPHPSGPGSTSGTQPPEPGSSLGPHPAGPGSISGSQPFEPISVAPPPPELDSMTVSPPPEAGSSAPASQPPEPNSMAISPPPEAGTSAPAPQPAEGGSTSTWQELSISDFETGHISFEF